jgi:hypothetical protein
MQALSIFSTCNLKRSLRLSLIAIASLSAGSAAFAQTLPPNPQPTCTVPQTTFNGWFQSGTPGLNDIVKPANSITFSNPVANCAFYQWSQQMFMWLTSPAPAIYGGGSRVFDTDVFYDVSPPNLSNNNQRTFVPHEPHVFHFFPMRSAQVGPHGLPILLDKAGHLLEVVDPQTGPHGSPAIQNSKGQLIEVSNVKVGAGNKAIFLDTKGNAIAPLLVPHGQLVPRERILPSIRAEVLKRPEFSRLLTSPALSTLRPDTTVQRFIMPKFRLPIFVNFEGIVVETEQGQADGSVLLAQGNHLIYFATLTNDVYAYFLTGVKDGGFTPTPTVFPTTQNGLPSTPIGLNQIQAFATAHGGPTFTDGIALTMEIKTAWVEASNLSDPQDYITTTGTIPLYTQTSGILWTATGTTKTTTLALVSMHLVGSANGHPEMIWATFEHNANAPRATYQYNSTSGPQPQTVNPVAGGNWLFASTGTPAPGSFNNAHADYFNAPNIEGTGGFNISASDTLHMKPFGGGANQPPNPLDATAAASNTEVISIDENILAMMASAGASADIRNNYVMSGATWTEGGQPPSGLFPAGNAVGTSLIENTALETYDQGPDTNANGLGCFSCHNGNMLGAPQSSGLSHVYGDLIPLF